MKCRHTLFWSRTARYETTEGEQRNTKESREWQGERTGKLNRQEPTKERDSWRIKEDKKQSVKERRVNENVKQAPRDEENKQSNTSLKEQNYTGNKELDIEKKRERAETKEREILETQVFPRNQQLIKTTNILYLITPKIQKQSLEW